MLVSVRLRSFNFPYSSFIFESVFDISTVLCVEKKYENIMLDFISFYLMKFNQVTTTV